MTLVNPLSVARHTWRSYAVVLRSGGDRSLVLVLLSLAACWCVYVPVHELTHVLGAVGSGGTVTELALQPQYGGTLLRPIFPFIVADSEYAGQLTGFEVPNDLAYAVVDLLPYVWSLAGVALVELARRRTSPALFSLGFLLTWVAFVSIPGDLYEAASLLTTRMAHAAHPELSMNILRSDDVVLLYAELSAAGTLDTQLVALMLLGVAAAAAQALALVALSGTIAAGLFGLDGDLVPLSSPAETRG